MQCVPNSMRAIITGIRKLLSKAKQSVNPNAVTICNQNEITKPDNKDSFEVDSNYLGILTYYININSLLKINVILLNEIEIPSMWENIEYYFIAFINLDIFSLSYDTCPFSSMTTISKALLKMLIVVFIILVWLILFIMVLMLRKLKCFRRSNSLRTFKYKLIEGFIETKKFTYSLKAGTVFYFLTCVQAGSKYRWLYDGTLECYSVWQKVVIAYLVYDVIPFSAMLIMGLSLLRQGHISAKGFMVACFLPLPILIYLTVMYTIKWKKVGKSKTKQLSRTTETILNSLQGPYREQGLTFGWEGIIEFRKLVFNLLTLVPNDVLRLILCGFGCMIAFAHHLIILPFKGVKDNLVESASLLLLTMYAICNVAKAVLSDFGTTPESHAWNEHLFQALEVSEHIFLASLLTFIIILELLNVGKKVKK